jgi:HemY protein
MRHLIAFLLVLTLAIGVGVGVYDDPGLVLISYQKWVVQLPLWLGVILLVGGVFSIWFIFHLFLWLFNIPHAISNWQKRRMRRASAIFSTNGFIALAEGRWEKALSLLNKGAKRNASPLLNYLGAAIASQELENDGARDEYLAKAHEVNPDAQIAIGLTQAKLQVQHGQYEQSLATLIRLRQLAPKHIAILSLLKEVYIALKDWDQLKAVMPELQRYHIVHSEEYEQLQKIVTAGQLEKARRNQDAKLTLQIWQDAPAVLKRDPELLLLVLPELVRGDCAAEAEKCVRETLKTHWNSAVVNWYGQIPAQNTNKQISSAENWLKDHPHDAVLLLTLGRLCTRAQLWGKAQSYLQASIDINPTMEAYVELGRVCEQLGNMEQANQCFRKAVAL